MRFSGNEKGSGLNVPALFSGNFFFCEHGGDQLNALLNQDIVIDLRIFVKRQFVLDAFQQMKQQELFTFG